MATVNIKGNCLSLGEDERERENDGVNFKKLRLRQKRIKGE